MWWTSNVFDLHRNKDKFIKKSTSERWTTIEVKKLNEHPKSYFHCINELENFLSAQKYVHHMILYCAIIMLPLDR